MGIHNKSINSDSLFQRIHKPIQNEIDGELVILNIETSEYFTLNKVGTVIWNYLNTQRTFSQIVDYLISEYNISKQQCEGEVQDFLNEMVTNGIIVHTNE